jgi:hypothetical protein
MSLQVFQVDPATVQAIEGIRIDIPALAYIGVDDGEVVGSCGLAWGGGRCWIWLRLQNGKPSYAITVVRRARSLLAKAHQLGEVNVFTPRDANFRTSENLLTKLGFRFFAVEDGIEVWCHERV